MRNLENRLSILERQLKPSGRHFYVWKDSEGHRQAEEQYQPGDVIHLISWLEVSSECRMNMAEKEGAADASLG